MFDSLLIIASLAVTPVKDTATFRPSYVPAPKAPIVLAVASVTAPEFQSTCYANRNGCWSE
jgi:hypothetical protein